MTWPTACSRVGPGCESNGLAAAKTVVDDRDTAWDTYDYEFPLELDVCVPAPKE